jgi:hypothetical protein
MNGSRHDWKIGGARTFQDLGGIYADLPIRARKIGIVAYQATGRHEFALTIRRHPWCCRRVD